MIIEACYIEKCAITYHNGMLRSVIYSIVNVLRNRDVIDLKIPLHNMTLK